MNKEAVNKIETEIAAPLKKVIALAKADLFDYFALDYDFAKMRDDMQECEICSGYAVSSDMFYIMMEYISQASAAVAELTRIK